MTALTLPSRPPVPCMHARGRDGAGFQHRQKQDPSREGPSARAAGRDKAFTFCYGFRDRVQKTSSQHGVQKTKCARPKHKTAVSYG